MKRPRPRSSDATCAIRRPSGVRSGCAISATSSRFWREVDDTVGAAERNRILFVPRGRPLPRFTMMSVSPASARRTCRCTLRSTIIEKTEGGGALTPRSPV